jgi:putative hydrolase of HD superfamily
MGGWGGDALFAIIALSLEVKPTMSSLGSKQIRQPIDRDSAEEAFDHLLALSRLAVKFAGVTRAPRQPDGRKESDVEHSYHLALSATELAAAYFPDLDTGLVAQFSLIHDLPELHVGDTPTFNITDEDRAKKEQVEKAALVRLLAELPPHTAELLERYERQEDPEARFVRFVDKILPALMVLASGTASMFKTDYDLTSPLSLQEIRARETARLQSLFPDFPFIQMVREKVIARADAEIFPEAKE